MLDVVLIAGLTLAPDQENAWRALSLDASAMEWPDAAPLFNGQSDGAHATVGDVLDALRAAIESEQGKSFFQREGDAVTAFLPADLTTLFHQDLATALRLAGHVGGEGVASFFLPSESAALVVAIGEDKDDECPEFQPASNSFQDEALAAEFLEVHEWLRAKEADPALTRGAFVAARKRFDLGPVDAAHAKLLADLASVTASRLYPAVQDVLTPRSQPLSSVWPDESALAEAIASAEPLARVVGLELLARTEPARAELLAPALSQDSSSFVRRAVMTALAHIPTAGAFDHLLASLSGEERGAWALDSLVASKWPGADAKLLSLLDASTPFGPSLWADLAPGTPGRAAAATHAARLLHALGKRKTAGAVPRLFALWMDHPAREVRKEAARALAFAGGPEVQAREQDLMFTLMGMGKALNGDDARRREILGISEPDQGGILRFADLDKAGLETLAEEGFLDPQGTQNDSPSAAQFFALMTEHPEVTASGYAVSTTRFDYRVTLDGLYADLSKVPSSRKEALRELFQQMGESATDAELEGDGMSLWWT